jgi:DNA polymerase-3 subunit gamma/tau
LNEIIEKGFDCGHLVAGLGRHIRDVLVSKDPATVQLLEVSATIKARYAQQAEVCSVDFLYEALKVIEQCEMQYKVRMEKRLCVELAFIRLCQVNELKKKI